MKLIGLIGGMSWESSALYYKQINSIVRRTCGGNANARSLMLTLDFAAIEELQHRGDWAQLGRNLTDAAILLERAGSDCIVLCTNTMHKLAGQIEEAVSIPMLHIVDATARAVKRLGVQRVGLLGTRFTMEDGFYEERMSRHDLEVVTPSLEERLDVHRIIYDELCQGLIHRESRQRLQEIMSRLADEGVGGIVLGCTELCLLVSEQDCPVKVFDSTEIHAEEAVHFCLADQLVPGL